MSVTKSRLPIIIGALAVIGIAGGAYFIWADKAYDGMGHHSMSMAHHGADGKGHDEATMPGLRGENVTERESEEMAAMFRKFETLSRTVTNLPNGIRTVTSSSDPDVMASLASHVVGMIERVEAKDDPKVIIQSRTLDIFFERSENITTQINMTDAGIEVVQTSDDPDLVEALQTHAAEVSDMAARGMQAVHEKLAKQN